MRDVLVTGATGFVGGHLVERLAAEGVRVRCLVRTCSAVGRLERLGVALHVGDVAEPAGLREAVRGVRVVYHAAGVTHALRAAEQMRVNRDGVARLLEACAGQADPPVFVLVSSIAAVGPARRGEVRTEADRPAPASRYGLSKRAGERVAERWARDVPITVVRPGVVFGPRDRNLAPVFRSIERFGIHVTPAIRTPRLSLIHVKDLAELLARAAERGRRLAPSAEGAGPGYYFACAPEHPTYGELGRLIGEAIGRRVAVIPAPSPVACLVALGAEAAGRWRGRSSPLRVDKIREARCGSWACEAEAARRELAFQPPKPLCARFAETAAWFRRDAWRQTGQ